MSENNNGLKRQIGLFGAVTILVGAVIGSGIFMTPGTVAAAAGSFGPFMAAWILAGASGILCALVYAELSPAMPESRRTLRLYNRSLWKRRWICIRLVYDHWKLYSLGSNARYCLCKQPC